ncbi:hypothetical protein L6164_026433 [Bauhinia variegata]|uniref:Uncharacterized protein n=1 Tax=Bauhinia variegata TaxID=167791 RepID=A0ACB9LQ37_BAUVA|nr:hypothetical protein L6164_026433 [Bauhinia variegata]
MSSSDLNQPPLKDPPVKETTPFESKECRESSGAVAGPERLSFQPREEELIAVYLFNKVAGKDDVSMVKIPECDLYGTKNPWEIWQEFLEDSNCKSFSRDKNELYLFTTLKKKENFPSRFDRRVGLGAWRFEGGTHTVSSKTQRRERVVVGSKKRYRFDKRGSEHHGGWIMMEYSLDDSLLQQISNPNEHIVLCKIRKNGRTARVGTGEKKPLELKDAVAAIDKKNGDENKKEILDLLNGRFPELVISMDEVLSYLDHDNSD